MSGTGYLFVVGCVVDSGCIDTGGGDGNRGVGPGAGHNFGVVVAGDVVDERCVHRRIQNKEMLSEHACACLTILIASRMYFGPRRLSG